MDIGKRLKLLRAERNLSQDDIGKIIRRPQNSISQMENNRMPLDDYSKQLLIEALDLPSDYFNEDDKQENENNGQVLKKTLDLLTELIEEGSIKHPSDIKEEYLDALVQMLVLDAKKLMKDK